MGLINREPTTMPPPPDDTPEIAEGTLGVWSTYYDQADPLIIFRDGGWDNLTIDHLKELLNGKS